MVSQTCVFLVQDGSRSAFNGRRSFHTARMLDFATSCGPLPLLVEYPVSSSLPSSPHPYFSKLLPHPFWTIRVLLALSQITSSLLNANCKLPQRISSQPPFKSLRIFWTLPSSFGLFSVLSSFLHLFLSLSSLRNSLASSSGFCSTICGLSVWMLYLLCTLC